MANIVAQAFGGFIGGLVAGLIGYVTELTLGAVFQAFGTLSSWFIVLGIVYAIISFIMGLAEAYTTGLFFTVGIISAGWFLGDAVTVVGGFISIAGLVLSLLRKR
jgi:hypothetical protein